MKASLSVLYQSRGNGYKKYPKTISPLGMNPFKQKSCPTLFFARWLLHTGLAPRPVVEITNRSSCLLLGKRWVG